MLTPLFVRGVDALLPELGLAGDEWSATLSHSGADTTHTIEQKVAHLRDALRLGELGLRIARGDAPSRPSSTVWMHIMEVDHV